MRLPREYYQTRAKQMAIGADPSSVWSLFNFRPNLKSLAIYTFLPWVDGDWMSYRTDTPPVLPRPEDRA